MYVVINMKFRAFIAIEISVTKEMIDMFNMLRNTKADLKLVEVQNVHLTLKFLGDTDEHLIKDIEAIMKDCIIETNMQPITVKIVGMGAFPNISYPRVIWLGMYGADKIITLAQLLDEKLSRIGFESERRAFSPHITVARVKSRRNLDKLQRILQTYRNIKFSEQCISAIKLKKSVLTPKGPVYSDVVTVSF